MTNRELVRHFFPTASDDQCGDVLWMCTGWPGFFSGDPVRNLVRQLSSASRRSNRDAARAMYLADRKMEDVMRKFNRREARQASAS